MKTKTFRNLKVVIFMAFVFSLIFATFSCYNLFSDVTTSYTPPRSADKPAGEGHRTITVTGTIRNPYEQPRNQSRSAIPSYDYSDKKYVVTAKAQGETNPVSGTADTTNNTFSIPLELGKIWTINVQLQKKETGDSAYVKVMEGTYTFTQALTEVNAGISIEIRPTITESGTGKIALEFATPTDELYDSVAAEPVSAEQKDVWSTHVTTSATGISGTGIQSGVYSVTIRFYKSNVLVYATMQEISVYDNMTTSVWDDGGANSPISGGTFTVTQALIDTFKRTSIFVASATSSPAGNNNNSGTPYSPLKSISEAIRRISVTGAGEAYTIWLMSDITDSVNVTPSGYLNGKASSITIQPMGNPVTISGSSNKVFDIRVPIPFTFENLTITGAAPSGGLGAAFYIESNAKVTLSNCTITGNSVTSDSNGGGIFCSGTLNVKGKIIISGNTKGSGSSAVPNNIFLYEDKKINIVGPLDPDSRIGVITGTRPSYGSPHVFTSGFGTNSGLEDTAISTIFTCDEGYAVLAGSGSNAGEATLEASGGSISNAFDYAVTLSCEDENIVPSSIITVTAAVTKGGNTIIPAADDISWSFDLLCGGDSVATLQGVSLVGYGAVTIPSDLKIFDNVTYTLHAKAVVNGVAYDEDFALIGNSDTLSAQGFVAVTGATVSGAVGSGNTASNVFIAGRTVTIPNLLVCDHEVTQAEYAAVMGENPSLLDGSSQLQPAENEKQKNRPVERVSWFKAIAYCNKRSSADGLTPCYTINNSTDPDDWGSVANSIDSLNAAVVCDFNADGYRLPTEAEWEYIARSGNGLTGTQYIYSGNNTASAVAWSSTDNRSDGMSHEIKKKSPNDLGIYDMSGNVWEWCWDRAVPGENDIPADITTDTPYTGSETGNYRVCRGGSYYREDARCALTYRDSGGPLSSGYRAGGFRVVRTNKIPEQLAEGTTGTAGTGATYMYFGEWPQTKIASGVTVNESISKENGLFTYYYGSDGAWYVKQAENAYVADYTYSDGTTVAQGGTNYQYFKVEPIKWCVLTTNYNGSGKKLLLAENILSNIQFYNSTADHGSSVNITVHANNYEHSRIRAYLNGIKYDINGECNDFVGKGVFQTAFTDSSQSQIANTTVMVGSDAITNNKVFLLSIEEATSSDFGFNETSSRIRNTTDFAKASGAVSAYWLRSPSEDGNGQAYSIGSDGVGGRITVHGGNAHYGVLPAICIDN